MKFPKRRNLRRENKSMLLEEALDREEQLLDRRPRLVLVVTEVGREVVVGGVVEDGIQRG